MNTQKLTELIADFVASTPEERSVVLGTLQGLHDTLSQAAAAILTPRPQPSKEPAQDGPERRNKFWSEKERNLLLDLVVNDGATYSTEKCERWAAALNRTPCGVYNEFKKTIEPLLKDFNEPTNE